MDGPALAARIADAAQSVHDFAVSDFRAQMADATPTDIQEMADVLAEHCNDPNRALTWELMLPTAQMLVNGGHQLDRHAPERISYRMLYEAMGRHAEEHERQRRAEEAAERGDDDMDPQWDAEAEAQSIDAQEPPASYIGPSVTTPATLSIPFKRFDGSFVDKHHAEHLTHATPPSDSFTFSAGPTDPEDVTTAPRWEFAGQSLSLSVIARSSVPPPSDCKRLADLIVASGAITYRSLSARAVEMAEARGEGAPDFTELSWLIRTFDLAGPAGNRVLHASKYTGPAALQIAPGALSFGLHFQDPDDSMAFYDIVDALDVAIWLDCDGIWV